MLIGYARTSTAEQEAGLDAQERDLRAAGCEKIYAERVSSVAADRARLAEALRFVRSGDVLVVTKPDRLARSTADLLSIVTDLEKRGVALLVLSMGGQPVDTRGATGKLLLTMLAAIAAFERDLVLERQREGISAAKAAGKYKGRAPTARAKASEVLALHAQGVAVAEIARRLNIGTASAFRILRDSRSS
ncbi:recombinase family protein [Teichococcus aestuarii]|uniref:recombinase family protein n=1 Tax=Teichococcus aestuarii TaxID=568898 RepID=UPI00361AB53F